MEPGTCHTDLTVEKLRGEGWWQKNYPKAKRRERPLGKCHAKHMEMMPTKLTTLEPSQLLLTDNGLLLLVV